MPNIVSANFNELNQGGDIKGTEESLLWDGFVRNDKKVLEQFYAQNFPTTRRYVLENSGSDEDAQDLFQEAVLTAWLNIKDGKLRFDNETNIGGYVFRIAKFKWLDRLRSAAFTKRKVMVSEETLNIASLQTDENLDERLEKLQTIYAQLDTKCRTILEMFYYKKMNLESIAEELSYDIGSIRTMKYRCMMKLREFGLKDS